MKLHIGKLIGLRLEQVGMSKAEFARRINRSPQNIQDLLTRASVDTALLTVIGKVLSYNFFHAFINSEDVLADLKKKELNGFTSSENPVDGKSKKDGKSKSNGQVNGQAGNEIKMLDVQKTLLLISIEQKKMRAEILKLKKNK